MVMRSHRTIAYALAGGLFAVAGLLAPLGCDNPDKIQPEPAGDATPSPQSPEMPAFSDANAPDDPNGAVMATVNGKPIPMARLHRLLVRTEGLSLAMQLVVNELVEQEAAKHDLTVSNKDVRREGDETIARGFGGRELTAEQRDALLEQYLKQTGIPRAQWDLTMYRNALLGKLLARTVKVSDQQLRDEFNRRFGRQVVVRHIEVSSLADARSVLKELQAGKDFATVAGNHSINPSAKDGGLLPPISSKTIGVPPAMRSVAVSMEKVGELSDPVKVETTFHILKLEKVIPPRDVKFENKKDELRDIIHSRVVNQQKQTYLMQLYQKAVRDGRIRFANPVLQAQFKKRVEAESAR